MGSTPRSRTLGTSASKVPNVGYRADPLSATGRYGKLYITANCGQWEQAIACR